MHVAITQKTLNKYYHAKKDFGPCLNDDYNKAHKLLTYREWNFVHLLHKDVMGIEGGRMTLTQARKSSAIISRSNLDGEF